MKCTSQFIVFANMLNLFQSITTLLNTIGILNCNMLTQKEWLWQLTKRVAKDVTKCVTSLKTGYISLMAKGAYSEKYIDSSSYV